MVKTKPTKVTRIVDEVLDGDTFRVKTKVNGSNYIRLEDIDTPEKGERDYSQAKQALKKQIEGKKVTITTSTKCHFGRPLAKVTQNRTNVSKSMDKFSKKGGKK